MTSRGRRNATAPAAIFEQDWWLQAASLGHLQTVETLTHGRVTGRLSVHPERLYFLRRQHPPRYTRLMAPWLAPSPSGRARRVRSYARLISELHSKAPPCDSFRTVVRAEPELLLAYALCGFKLTPRFTFISPREDSAADVLDGVDQKLRNLVRAAERSLGLVEHHDFDRFRRLSQNRRGPDQNDYRVLAELWAAIRLRRTGTLIAVTGTGEDLASALLVWDADTLYFLVAARAPGPAANKAYAFLFFQALSIAKGMGLDFDADGFADLARGWPLARWGLPVVADVEISRETRVYQGLRLIARGAEA